MIAPWEGVPDHCALCEKCPRRPDGWYYFCGTDTEHYCADHARLVLDDRL